MFACICVARAKRTSWHKFELWNVCWCVTTTFTLIPSSHLMSRQIFWLEEMKARQQEWQFGLVFSFSSGTMMRKLERGQRSDRTTGPCCPISARRPEEATRTLLTGRTDSSATGGWKVSTHSEDRRGFSIFQTHPRTEESFPDTGGIPNIFQIEKLDISNSVLS